MVLRLLSFSLFILGALTQNNFLAMQGKSELKELFPFTLISTNILDEELYQTLSRPPKSGMSWEKREKIFLKELEKQLVYADILCMQEFNSQTQAAAIKYLKNNNFQGYSVSAITTPSIWFKENIFSAINQNYYAFKTIGAQTNGFAITILTPKNKTEPIIGIINAHLNNNTPTNTTYDQFRLDQIQEILTHVDNPKAKDFNWIICGDFNTDRRTHIQIMQPFITRGFADSHHHQPATAKSSQEKNPLKSIDYVWFKGNNLQLTNTDIYPSINKFEEILLSHRPSDNQGTFFTDHAILKTQFKLIIPQTIQK